MTSMVRLHEVLATVDPRATAFVVAVLATLLIVGVLALAQAVPGLASGRILRVLRARPLARLEAPELFEVVDRLCRAGGIRMPAITMIPHDQVNVFAFAAPRRPVLAPTRGAVDGLSRAELEAAVSAALARLSGPGLTRSTVGAALGAIPTALAGMGVMRCAEIEDSPLSWFPALFLVPFGALLARLVGGPVPGSEADLAGIRLSGRTREGARVLEHMEFTAHVAPMAIPAALARLALVNPRGAPAPLSLVSLFPAPAASAPRAAVLRSAPTGPVIPPSTPDRPRPIGRAA